jgi:hypothetical protein
MGELSAQLQLEGAQTYLLLGQQFEKNSDFQWIGSCRECQA